LDPGRAVFDVVLRIGGGVTAYGVYQVKFHFSPTTLTAVFAVYFLVLLVTLLACGSLSNYLGRLPVIIASLVLSAAACLVFLMAHDVGALYGPEPCRASQPPWPAERSAPR
jgi:MFS family permease